MDINFNSYDYSGNDENKSETDRNSKKITKKTPSKHFMIPTISAKSKSISPRKRVLTEWNENSTNIPHEKPSNLGKKTTFDKLGVSKNSIPRIPTLPFSVLNDDNDENVEIGDNFVVPYDPLTNYVSPRPEFLRYNPSRLRNGVVSSGESCLIDEKEFHNDDEEEMIDDDDDDEEEVIEETKWSLKWEVVKYLMVFCVLVVSLMYIASMNLNMSLFDDHRYGNITSGVVSLFEIDKICVESDRIRGCDVDHENEIVISEASHLGSFIDKGLKWANDVVAESEISSLVDSNNSDLVNLEPKCQVREILGHVFFGEVEENDVDFEAKLNDVGLELENEVENVYDKPQFEAGLVSEEANVKIKLMDNNEIVALVGEDVDFEENSIIGGLELENEVNAVGYKVESVHEEPQFEAEVVGEEPRGDIRLNDEDETLVTLVGEDVEYEQNEITVQTSKSVVLVLIMSLMTLVVTFLVKLYYKCKKARTTMTSNVKKLCSQQETNKQKLPPKVTPKKLEPIQTDDSYLGSLSNARSRAEITPTSRVIPKVSLLCEFDVVVGEARRSSLRRCDMSSKKEEERIVLNKSSESYTTSSHLQPSRSYISKEMASNKHGKQETISKATPTRVRRSSRLSNRRATPK